MIEKKILKAFINKKLSILPLKKDKRPNVSSWKKYQSTFINVEDNAHLFESIGLICGKISGGIEVIDVDQKNEIYQEEEGHLIDRLQDKINLFNQGLYDKLTVAKTINGGYHLIYKCDKIAGNVKLASREGTKKEQKKGEKKVVLLETRGESGYIVSAPTEGYEVIQGKLSDIPTITSEERDTIFSCCRMFDETMPPVFMEKPNITWGSKGLTPWDDFNDRGDWQSVLVKHSWKIVGEKGTRINVQRPGATSPISGNFNKNYNLLRVFSTSSIFESDRSYNPFSIYAMLECGGDHKKAAIELKEMGYGRTPETKFKKLDEPADLDNSHEYLADTTEEENIYKFASGELELGLRTGYPDLDEYYRFKKDQFNIIGGIYNTGKSTMIWLFKLLENTLHGMRTAFFCPENRMWTVKMSMIELLLGKKINKIYKEDKSHIQKCLTYLNREFKFIEIEDDVSYKDILDVADEIISKENLDSFVIDPYNSIMKLCYDEIDRKLGIHDYHYAVADKFKKWSMSRRVGVTVNMHPTSEANRKVHQSGEMKGYQMPCRGVDLEGGGKWGNKVDDLMIVHRYYKHSDLRIVTEIHIDKIKNQWSGGRQTPDDEPVKLIYKNYEGFLGFYDSNNINPLRDWAKINILGEEIVSTKKDIPTFDEYVYDNTILDERQEQHEYNKGSIFKNSRPKSKEGEEENPPY